jgi:hypothetical protein
MTPAIRRGRQARIGRNGSEKGHADFLQSQSQEIFYYFYILRNILQASIATSLKKSRSSSRVTNFGASSISPLIVRIFSTHILAIDGYLTTKFYILIP